ncbi:MAG: antibiotic biosynthesis monooxygenase [Candidatus Eisenbacteria bacterium]|uniref:Antibiotic biosynthesis monooxygenase n=1 Tax=Eiseniibacteriota bacterium TaxID=2212470 RepID=A0A538SHW1_UNCEI|nr:MAG: antibiotic biosynthesis monooxygenase [Candidatus Eisenbacteria bacterium]TMQ55474.1 MAG: antibiotic biosynthesis monooxygenase [Candidatus Eisenbacteria bacterium]
MTGRGTDMTGRGATGTDMTGADVTELFIFARFHAHPGKEKALEEALRDNLTPTRKEPGCMNIHLFRSIRDPRLFYIHSRFNDEAAFELHAGLPHTVRMVSRVEPLIDHPFEATRAEQIA